MRSRVRTLHRVTLVDLRSQPASPIRALIARGRKRRCRSVCGPIGVLSRGGGSVGQASKSDQPDTGVHILTVKYVPGLDSQVMPCAAEFGSMGSVSDASSGAARTAWPLADAAAGSESGTARGLAAVLGRARPDGLHHRQRHYIGVGDPRGEPDRRGRLMPER